MAVSNAVVSGVAAPPCLCGSPDIRIRVADDINYPEKNVWFVARVLCGNCGSGGQVARCSDAAAAMDESVRLWRDLVEPKPSRRSARESEI